MKNLFFALILICLFNSKYSAQDNTAFEKGTIVATAGYGFPDFYRTSLRLAYNGYDSRTVRGFGPLILKGDYGIVKFKWGHSVGAGIVLGYSSTTVTYTEYNTVAAPITGIDLYKTITIGARGTYHFFTKEKLDCYVSLGAGFNINTYDYSNSGSYAYGVYAAPARSRSTLYESATVGVRYYFTKNIGVYSELGWDMSAPIQGGVAIKF